MNFIDLKKIEVGLVQINNSFSGQNYLPYSVGILESYVKKHISKDINLNFRDPIYKRTGINITVENLLGANIIGFSVYVWNFQISLEIAKRIKKRDPHTLIIFGGPHVPDNETENFLRKYDFIDLAVHGEGERTLTDIIENFYVQNWSDIDGLSFVNDQGSYIRTTTRQRLRNLSDIPSPLLDGTFESLMKANPDEKWIGLWETNRGCPFKCAFCDWGSATGDKVASFEETRLHKEVDWFSNNKIEFVFCCDANFGIKKRDIDLANYIADKKEETGYPHALSVQNTKNATERAYQTQKILSDAGLNKGVALSMQSLDPHTLKAIKRDNISLDTYLELATRFSRDKVETFSDIILGNPEETYDTLVSGVDTLINFGQHNRIQFNNLSILPNAEMGNKEYQKEHGMVTVVSEIINIHGEKIKLEDDVPEFQELVVATKAMPKEMWRKTRAFCWMAAFLHFDKIFQIPLIISHTYGELSYKEMITSFIDADEKLYPIIAKVRDLFIDQARVIQEGGAEFLYSPNWLGIHWPQDEYAFIMLTKDNQINDSYIEAKDILEKLLLKNNLTMPSGMLEDCIKLNQLLLKSPGKKENVSVELKYNILDVYNGVRNGEPYKLNNITNYVLIKREESSYTDFQKWCREVVWWGNKKGAYLYDSNIIEKSSNQGDVGKLAGHF
jgi:radical SAM superfamily enzyme YgiQ (UPF0313 family)